jgi:hypothetical protein
MWERHSRVGGGGTLVGGWRCQFNVPADWQQWLEGHRLQTRRGGSPTRFQATLFNSSGVADPAINAFSILASVADVWENHALPKPTGSYSPNSYATLQMESELPGNTYNDWIYGALDYRR